MYSILLVIVIWCSLLLATSNRGRGNPPVTKDYSDALKGFFALMIVANHLASSLNESIWLEPLFRNIGFVCVAFFFFISGWGTMSSYSRSSRYLETYIANKVKKILIPYLIAVLMYVLAEIATGTSVLECILSFCNGRPVAQYSWYIISVFILYIGFWFAFVQKRVDPKYILGIEAVIYLLIVYCLKWPMNWYNTYIAFFAGIFAYTKRKEIVVFKHRALLTTLSFLCVIAVWVMTSYYTENSFVMLVLYWCGSLCACYLVFAISTITIFKSKIWSWLAEISFELYIYHGLTNAVLKHVPYVSSSNYLFVIAAYICAVGMAYVMHQVNKFIIRRIM